MGEIAKEGARVLLRRLDEGVIDNRRIYLNNKLIIRNTVRNLNEDLSDENVVKQTKREGES